MENIKSEFEDKKKSFQLVEKFNFQFELKELKWEQ